MQTTWTTNDHVEFELRGQTYSGFVTDDWPNTDAPTPLVRVWVVSEQLVVALDPTTLTLISTRNQRLGWDDPNDDFPIDRWLKEERDGSNPNG